MWYALLKSELGVAGEYPYQGKPVPSAKGVSAGHCENVILSTFGSLLYAREAEEARTASK